MVYEITYAQSALRSLRKLDRQTAQRVLRAIASLEQDPRPIGSRQLAGGSGERRIRVGQYRVIYDVYDHEVRVLVLKIGH